MLNCIRMQSARIVHKSPDDSYGVSNVRPCRNHRVHHGVDCQCRVVRALVQKGGITGVLNREEVEVEKPTLSGPTVLVEARTGRFWARIESY